MWAAQRYPHARLSFQVMPCAVGHRIASEDQFAVAATRARPSSELGIRCPSSRSGFDSVHVSGVVATNLGEDNNR